MGFGDLAGLAGDGIAEIDHLVASALGQCGSGGKGGGRGGDDAILGTAEGRITGLGCFVGGVGERRADGRRHR